MILLAPLTNNEIKDLLSATLHGPLPKSTMSRVFSSLDELVRAREAINALQESPKKDEPSVEAAQWLSTERSYYKELWLNVYTKCIDPNEVVTYGDICDRAVRMANAACRKVCDVLHPEDLRTPEKKT